MKKFIFYLLILLLITAMFTGCGETPITTEIGEKENTQENTPEPALEGMGDKLSATYVDMMKNGKYLMKYKTTMEFEGQSMEVEATVAVSGDNAAIISNGGGVESTIISKDDKSYMIDHTNKTVFVMSQGTVEDGETVETDGITYVGNGIEDGLDYEEYTTVDGTIKYYFDGKELVKMAVMVEGETMVMEIIEMNNSVPDNMFQIPTDYKEISMIN